MRFAKVSGSGNDFLALLEPERSPTPAEIAAWCRRGVSEGADGLFVLRRELTAVRMDYWNADGQPADLCVNGTRCAARLAFERGWAASQVTVETGAGPLVARRLDGARIALELQPPSRPERRAPLVDGAAVAGSFVTVGVPHFVVFWPRSLADAPVGELGAALRRHPDFAPAGTNVDFVRFPAPHALEIRSFERGVEAETLACGTGVLAAVAAGLATRSAELPVEALTLGGFRLAVEGEAPGGEVRRWSLAGDARIVAEGELTAESAVAVAPARFSPD